MFSGMTLGEQRALLAVIVIIAAGLGWQSWQNRQAARPLWLEAPPDAPAAVFQSPHPPLEFSAPSGESALAAQAPGYGLTAPAQAPAIPENPYLSASAAAPNRVNINTASAGELERLPGIGPVRAQAIIDYRQRHGGFRTVEELVQVSGIGEATLDKIRPYADIAPGA